MKKTTKNEKKMFFFSFDHSVMYSSHSFDSVLSDKVLNHCFLFCLGKRSPKFQLILSICNVTFPDQIVWNVEKLFWNWFYVIPLGIEITRINFGDGLKREAFRHPREKMINTFHILKKSVAHLLLLNIFIISITLF